MNVLKEEEKNRKEQVWGFFPVTSKNGIAFQGSNHDLCGTTLNDCEHSKVMFV